MSTEWVETATTFYGLAAPFIAGALIRQGVKPVKAPKRRRQE